ncbi:MAG: hypothetical protein LWX51_10370 [Deltaproteobacteria bacterium]|nr:hypothetical protein [Deltaproteobacteria bacterium]
MGMPPQDKKHYNDRWRKEVAPHSSNLQKNVITITKQQVESQWLFAVAVNRLWDIPQFIGLYR